MNKITTRFAPSPTGFMHIGGVRTAIFAYLWARKNRGTFILRIEDTDKNREVAGSIEHIQNSLHWLEIDWDYGPNKPSPNFGSCLQSERLPIYKKYAQKLVDKGLAYPDPFTREEVETLRKKADGESRPFLFREHRPDTFLPWDGEQTLRLKTPKIKRYTWNDAVRGELSAGEEMLDDFILIKADGFPTYNFAHIVDDLEMNVTHIFRSDEFISSVPKFLSLYDALEISHPVFVTLPPIMGPDGRKKLSKRDGAKDILDYAKDGYLPSTMRNFLSLIGWNPGDDEELFYSESELIDHFSLEKIQHSGGAFNEEKLRWMNKEHIRHTLSEKQSTQYVISALTESTKSLPQYNEDRVEKLKTTILERIHNKVDIHEASKTGEYDWAFAKPEVVVEMLRWKNDTSVKEVLPRLEKAKELLEKVDFSSPETIKTALWQYAEEAGKGEVLWPLRVTLTGREKSPDPFTCAHVIGKSETLERIENAMISVKNL